MGIGREDDPEERDGLYIQQVAAMLGLSDSVLRRWEGAGIVAPARTNSNFRIYSGADVARLRRARELIRGEGLNVAGAVRALDEEMPGGAGRDEGGNGHSSRGSVGMRLRALRQRSGKSLRELAVASGLSASYISAVERSLSNPSVASLQKLCAALDSNLVEVLGGEASELGGDPVVRSGEEASLALDIDGVVIKELATVETPLEPLLFELAPGSSSGESYQHAGDEFVFVLVGRFEIVLDEATPYLLESGDSITFPSRRPHRWRNPDPEHECRLIWVNTPRTF
jgi:transcriptional regulator with XRE-family HTH domain